MPKFITVKVIEPDVTGLNRQQEEEFIEAISQDVARQIMARLKASKHQEDTLYWQQRMLEWKIEDFNHELKYGHLYEQRPDWKRIDEMGYSSKPNNSEQTD